MESWDIVVIGSGPSALRAAIASADSGTIPLVIDSSGVGSASGTAPLSGLAASIDELDSTAHRNDTVTAGGESTDKVAAARFCGEAVSVIAELERWGLVLRRREGGLPHTSEAPGHSRARLTGCGDSTSREVTRILEEQAIKRGIPRRSDLVPLSLVMDNQQVRGVVVLDLLTGGISSIQSKAIILATEGHQGIWSAPSNGAGIGAALAVSAGVGLSGMANSPRHPLTIRGTDMHLPLDLLGAGGRLRKESGEDVEIETILNGEGCVLDLRSLEAAASPWFTQTTRRVRERAGLDITTEVIPLMPSVAATTGGAPVDRSKTSNTVDNIVQIFNSRKIFRLALAPEGTRKKVEQLRTGFYHIAQKANVPIVMVAFDFGKKEIKIGEPFYATGSIESDFEKINRFYSGVKGKIPEYSFTP